MSALDRDSQPSPGPVRPFTFPEVEEARLPSGLELRVVRLPRLPVVSTVVVLPVGEAEVEPSSAGVALLAAESLAGGTDSRSATELAAAFESLGMTLGTAAGWDAVTLSVTGLAERLPEVLPLLGEILGGSVFPAEEVERAREQQLARIRQRAMDPGALAGDWTARLLYAEGMPYGRPLAGTEDSVASLDRARVASFAEGWLRPGGAGVVLAGDVRAEESLPLLERSLASWRGEIPPRPPPPGEARFRDRVVHVVDRPGAVQSELRVGHPAISHGHPDHHALAVANTVLGGAFTSRLNLSLRERHGFTYGVRSRFHLRRGPGPFLISTAVESGVTAAAVGEILAQLESFVPVGPTVEEVEAARDYLAGVFPLRLETSEQVAARTAELMVYGLPPDYHARYRERIRAVDRATAADAAARHLRPRQATVVVVGDAATVREPLEALELGEVHVHAAGDTGP